MGGEGSIQGMIIALRNNAALLKKRVNIFENRNSFTNRKIEFKRAAGKSIILSKASKEEIQALKQKILIQRKKDFTKRVLIVSFLGLIVAFLFFSAINAWAKGLTQMVPSSPVVTSQSDSHKYEMEKYDFYMEDAKKWLTKSKWHNAIYQYKAALKVVPNDYEASLGLAIAYTNRCQNENLDCDLGKELVEKLLKLNPQSSELKQLSFHYY